MTSMNVLKSISIAAVFFASAAVGQGLAEPRETCENAALSFEGNAGVKFSDSCGPNPKWNYVIKPNGATFLEFTLAESFGAAKGPAFDPDKNRGQCTVVIYPKYPKECTFSPSNINFFAFMHIRPDHKGRIGVNFADMISEDRRVVYHRDNIIDKKGAMNIKAKLMDLQTGPYWAPCDGQTVLSLEIFAEIEDIDKSKPVKVDSIISLDSGEFRTEAGISFKPCSEVFGADEYW